MESPGHLTDTYIGMTRLTPTLYGLALLSLVLLTRTQAGEDAVTYADPDGAFAFLSPRDWKPERSQFSEEGRITEFVSQGTTVRNQRFGVVALKPKNHPVPEHLEDNAKMLFNQVLSGIRDDGELITSRVSKVKYGAHDAMRCDLAFREKRDAPAWKGIFLVIHGTDHVFMTLLSAPEDAPDTLASLEKTLNTLALESDKPVQAEKVTAPEIVKPVSATTVNFESFAKPRDAADKVLSAGAQPLSYASLSAWANLIDYCFDLDLTEIECAEWKSKVIQTYPTLSSDEQALVASSGSKIWKRLNEAKPEELPRQKLETRALLRDFLGLPAHAIWVEPLLDAVHRRDRFVAATLALPPQAEPEPGQTGPLAVERFDNVFSASDLDAAVELLYFWATACGSVPAEKKIEEYHKDHDALSAAFDTFPPATQLLLSNAERVYGKMRTEWQAAKPSAREELVRVYKEYLAVLGFKDELEKVTWVEALKNGAGKIDFGIPIPRKVDRLKAALWDSAP